MKTKTLIKKLTTSNEPVEFTTKAMTAAVVITRPYPGSIDNDVRVYIGDGDDRNDFQYMKAEDLREVAKKFNAVADLLDGVTESQELL